MQGLPQSGKTDASRVPSAAGAPHSEHWHDRQWLVDEEAAALKVAEEEAAALKAADNDTAALKAEREEPAALKAAERKAAAMEAAEQEATSLKAYIPSRVVTECPLAVAVYWSGERLSRCRWLRRSRQAIQSRAIDSTSSSVKWPLDSR